MLHKLDKVDFTTAGKNVRRFIVYESELRAINKSSLSALISGAGWK